ncbi:MAG: signal peptidase I [Bacteroidales bacterium]|nr:signal peptidase I [Bacteroidales bacterium]
MKNRKIYRILGTVVMTVAAIVVLAVTVPVFFFDQFLIGGSSMEPTLHTGDHVLVNKLLHGARIYRTYDFSVPEMECFRMPGFRKVRPGDIVVFNNPDAHKGKGLSFRINDVYAKRCIGNPGDTVSVVNGFYSNSSIKGPIGNVMNQQELSETPDSVLNGHGVVLKAAQFAGRYGKWTIKDFGPLRVPAKGDIVKLSSGNVRLYSKIIRYETGMAPSVKDGKVLFGGIPVDEYEFTHDYYFFGGDNVLDSRDSRYFGLVPDEFIVGVATRVLFSRPAATGKTDRSRFWKKLP